MKKVYVIQISVLHLSKRNTKSMVKVYNAITPEQTEKAAALKVRIIKAYSRWNNTDKRKSALGRRMYWHLQNEFSGLMREMGIGLMIYPHAL